MNSEIETVLGDSESINLGISSEREATFEDFEIKKVIGTGAFSKVYLVEQKNNPGQVFAMKSLDKK
jgi:serine/threonine protein kinase